MGARTSGNGGVGSTSRCPSCAAIWSEWGREASFAVGLSVIWAAASGSAEGFAPQPHMLQRAARKTRHERIRSWAGLERVGLLTHAWAVGRSLGR